MTKTLRSDLVRDALFIDGRWVAPVGEASFAEVSNSGDGTRLASVVQASAADVELAVAAAVRAARTYSRWSVPERIQLLGSLADALEARAAELAELIALEVGTPLRVSEAVQVGMPIRVLRAYADALGQLDFQEEIGNSLVCRVPAGVVGAITPWNYPLHQAVAKLGAALAAGCPIVLKPSEVAPLSAFVLAEAAIAAGVPSGVVAIVPGRGPTVGEAIAAHPGIDVVSFTGSTRAGARVAALASQNITKVALELGGKSASIICDGADLPGAVKGSVRNAFLNSGQTCSAWTRMLVPRRQLDTAVELAVGEVGKLTVGHPLAAGTRLGPLVSATQQRSVLDYIRLGISDGLPMAAGGDSAVGPDGGYYVRPTIFADVPPDSRLATEEIFGPVLSIIAFDDEDDAVRIANESGYGLAGGVWAADEEQALGVARQLRTGQVDLNGGAFNPAAPFGGFRRSGIGRELGRFGIEEFLETTSIQR